MSDQDGAAVVGRLIGLLGALDVEAVLALTTDDLVLELPFRADGGPPRLEGANAHGFVRLMPRLFARLGFHDVVVHGQLPSGVVVAEYRSDGLTRSGRPYDNTYISVFGLRDGRVATWREYFDSTVIASAFAPKSPAT